MKLQAIVKRVDTLPVIGYILDTHHCIACSPSHLIIVVRNSQCHSTKPTSTLKGVEGAGGGGGGRELEGYNTIRWPFIMCYLQEIGKC